MEKILVLFTCFNRKDKTKKCICSLTEGNKDCDLSFVVVDDNSFDGTLPMLYQLKETIKITILKGSGALFYSGGMRTAMKYAKENLAGFDYLLLINDDVEWSQSCITKMIDQSRKQEDSVIVGATQDSNHVLSYGAIKYIKGIKYRKLGIEESRIEADTFNANCVLLPAWIFSAAPMMDDYYEHSLGDFDYGLELKRNGVMIYSSSFYVGVCDQNPVEGTWMDHNLSLCERLKAKESVKGAPVKQWFYFLKKNFGLPTAILRSITPYLRILLRM